MYVRTRSGLPPSGFLEIEFAGVSTLDFYNESLIFEPDVGYSIVSRYMIITVQSTF